jgi:hypothetical protein
MIRDICRININAIVTTVRNPPIVIGTKTFSSRTPTAARVMIAPIKIPSPPTVISATAQ